MKFGVHAEKVPNLHSKYLFIDFDKKLFRYRYRCTKWLLLFAGGGFYSKT